MNYTIQCKDIISGRTGCFGFSTKQYLSANEKCCFIALTPVFDNLVELFAHAKANNISLVSEIVNWGNK